MRLVASIPLLVVALTAAGCWRGIPPAGSPPGQGRRPPFAPGLRLNWPGPPSEVTQMIEDGSGDQWHYTATFTNKSPQGFVIYTAYICEYPPQALVATTPEEMVSAHVFASKKDETSRKEVALGPRQYPGLEITRRSGDLFSRRLVVMAGSRLYEVAVASRSEELLRGPDAEKFFDSFAIEE